MLGEADRASAVGGFWLGFRWGSHPCQGSQPKACPKNRRYAFVALVSPKQHGKILQDSYIETIHRIPAPNACPEAVKRNIPGKTGVSFLNLNAPFEFAGCLSVCHLQTGSMKTAKPHSGRDRGTALPAAAPKLSSAPEASPRRTKTPPAPVTQPEKLFDGRAIVIRGAREHNLKNIDLTIPRDKLVVFTGLSGSGKSSLAFDTIYAEGQRRYVESLSAYARQFLEMMQKPDVDQIDGLSPAISIEQKTTSKNPRSTVGTVTEIYDYMRLLFARVGIPYSPATGLPIESQTVSQMVDRVIALPERTRLYLIAPVIRGRKGEYRKEIAEFMKRGFQRLKIDGQFYEIADAPVLDKKLKHDIEVVVDRIAVRGRHRSQIVGKFRDRARTRRWHRHH